MPRLPCALSSCQLLSCVFAYRLATCADVADEDEEMPEAESEPTPGQREQICAALIKTLQEKDDFEPLLLETVWAGLSAAAGQPQLSKAAITKVRQHSLLVLQCVVADKI